ncbi:MAG: M20/M25/M40 family metallo-hydrolase [bacterium]
MTLFELTKKLIDIPSITGSEEEIAEFLSSELKKRGFEIKKQLVEPGRPNILATTEAKPRVILCTHLDTVPPHIPASEDDNYIYGRGACDVKGIIAAMIFAARKLLEANIKEFGLLFVVGEETDSIGAKKANAVPPGSDFIIVGEPTENKLGAGHKGIVNLRIFSKGKAAHSSFPEMGESAIEKLLNALQRVREIDFGEDEILGKSTLNIGTIEGGTAFNVVPEQAGAALSLRNSIPAAEIVQKIKSGLNGKAEIEILTQSEPQKLHTVPGFETAVLPFGSDIPHLKNFGKPLLIGPGSARVAHSDNEKIEKGQLTEAIDIYLNLVKKLLAE